MTTPGVLDVDLKGKATIVTGSNTGIGYECAAQLLNLGLSTLVLAVRDEAKREAGRKRLLSIAKAKDAAIIEVWKLDLLYYDSGAAFAQRASGLALAVRLALLDKVQRKTSATDPFHGSKKKMAPEWDAEERHGTSKLVCQLFLSQLIKYVPASVAVVGLAAPPPGVLLRFGVRS